MILLQRQSQGYIQAMRDYAKSDLEFISCLLVLPHNTAASPSPDSQGKCRIRLCKRPPDK